ncbi:cysteine hydrolase [Rhodococcus sp. WS4]|nr:cysteine hydrolase [Rhodococcus sp. WS4]
MNPIDPLRTAIVAVHFVNDIVGPGGTFAPLFQKEIQQNNIVGNTVRLLDSARAAGAEIVYTRVAYRAGYTDLVANSPLLGMVVQQKCLLDGTAGAEFIEEVAPQSGDVVVTHQRVSGFHGTELDVLLRAAGIDTVVLAGVATNVSVESTARSASDRGYRTIVVSDACASDSPDAHKASLSSLELLAEVATTDDVISGFLPQQHQEKAYARD